MHAHKQGGYVPLLVIMHAHSWEHSHIKIIQYTLHTELKQVNL